MTVPHRLLRQANLVQVLLLAALSLTGCFDLTQQVQIGRDGGGAYRVSVAAAGLMGQALKEKPVEIDGMPRPQIRVDGSTGMVRQSSVVAFRALSDLKLPDELISLHVLERPLFGLGPTHVRFRRTFLIGNAEKHQAAQSGQPDAFGSQIMASVFGDHTYVFSVHLPGSVLQAYPLHLGKAVVEPTVTGDLWNGHTVTWTMPLYLALQHPMLSFEVDFSAYGTFADAESRPVG